MPSPGTGLARTIDAEDGIDGSMVQRKAAFFDGKAVEYWDLGTAPGLMRAAYQLYECKQGEPQEPLRHPIILAAIPGDTDYSPFLALQPVCATDAYRGEQIVSTRALRDATDIGIVEEPLQPYTWVDAPIVGKETILEGAKGRTEPIYYDGLALRSLRPLDPAPFVVRFMRVARVYELYLPMDQTPSQIVFEDAETPLWTIVRVQLAADADLKLLHSARDLFDVDEEGVLTVATDLVESHEETKDRVHLALVGKVELL